MAASARCLPECSEGSAFRRCSGGSSDRPARWPRAPGVFPSAARDLLFAVVVQTLYLAPGRIHQRLRHRYLARNHPHLSRTVRQSHVARSSIAGPAIGSSPYAGSAIGRVFRLRLELHLSLTRSLRAVAAGVFVYNPVEFSL